MNLEAHQGGSLSLRAATQREAGRAKLIVIGMVALGGVLVYWFARPVGQTGMPVPDKEVTIGSPRLPEPADPKWAEPEAADDAE